MSHIRRGGDQLAGLVSVLSVVRDADGTWDGSPDGGQHFPVGRAVCLTGGAPGAAGAYQEVARVLGGPTAPISPPTDWVGLAADLVPGGERMRDVVEAGVGLVEELRTLGDADTG